MAVNQTQVFVSHPDGSIRAFTLATLNATKPLSIASGGLPATSMVADEKTLYWMDKTGAVSRYDLANKQKVPVVKVNTQSCSQCLAVDSTQLYVVDSTSGVFGYPL